jgi:hypothetical protein
MTIREDGRCGEHTTKDGIHSTAARQVADLLPDHCSSQENALHNVMKQNREILTVKHTQPLEKFSSHQNVCAATASKSVLLALHEHR